MKKFICVMLVICLVLTGCLFAVSCTNSNNKDSDSSATDTESTSAAYVTGYKIYVGDTEYVGGTAISVEYGDSIKDAVTVKAVYSDGTEVTVTDYVLSQDVSGKAVGDYTVTVGYASYDEVTLSVTVTPKKLDMPVDGDEVLYTGELITYIPVEYVEGVTEISGNTATELGEYTLTLSITDKTNYAWSDGTTDDISVKWYIEATVLSYKVTETDETTITVAHRESDARYVATVTYPQGATYSIDQETGALTLTYAEASAEDLEFGVSGSYFGSLVFDVTDDNNMVLNLNGFDLVSETNCPIYILSADNAEISAKKSTVNSITDNREEQEDLKGAIYSVCDLGLKGKGELTVYSANNNGIHSKDDLEVKNLTLKVNVKDNALKGNDGVTIESGTLTLIARQGDGIKTSNSSLSNKGNQKGSIVITDGKIDIYAACDGIDAAFDVTVSGGEVNVYTDKYSEYSEEVTSVSDGIYYIKATTTAYKYSIYYFNDADDGVWVNSSSYKTVSNGRSNVYYYELEKPSGYASLKVYAYTSAQEQGQDSSYYRASSETAVNENYDTLYFNVSGGNFSWTNYTTTTGGPGGMGGMQEGNTDKGDYSTKGIKADNSVTISGGTIFVKAYDDAIHANSDVTLESGATPTGDVTITAGTLTLYSNDDAIHADGKATISGGTINITGSYEGVEGAVVEISGGKVSVVSSDDGINGTGTSGESIIISGGELYVYAGGDGVDSNSTDSYDGILFSGGKSVIISYGRADSSIDTERGYKYTGGYVVAIGIAGGMSNESTMSSPSVSSIGKTANVTLAKNGYLVVSDMATIQSPIQINAFVVVLGSTSATISSATSGSYTLDSNGVSWNI